MRRLLAAAILAAMPFLANATTYSTDVTDLWYIDAEHGWGVNFIQQEDTLFATLFVYGPDGKPTWYVAPGMIPTSSSTLTFAGDLYTTSTGTYFGAAWDPAALGSRKVGTATFTLDTITAGTLTYAVDGTQVTKHVVRQTWKNDDYNGSYWGSLSGTYSGCPNDSHAESSLSFSITQSGSSIKLQDSTNCVYTGTYSQAGRMGSFTTTGTGSGGCANSFNAVEVQGTITGLTMRASLTVGSCTLQAGISAVRR